MDSKHIGRYAPAKATRAQRQIIPVAMLLTPAALVGSGTYSLSRTQSRGHAAEYELQCCASRDETLFLATTYTGGSCQGCVRPLLGNTGSCDSFQRRQVNMVAPAQRITSSTRKSHAWT
eukprot:scaffold388_cov380-Prasinococcus_capsulatus_cf.AAC.31